MAWSNTELGSVALFAGGGGMTEGLAQASITTLFMNDNWAPATVTFSDNLGTPAFSDQDARDLQPEDIIFQSHLCAEKPLVVVGGPPCQGFSSAGARSASDDRNTLVGTFARLAVEMEALWVVFENVEGFLTMDRGRFVLDLLEPLTAGGYQVRLRKVDMAYYGVPQHRKRVVVLARRGRDPGFPPPLMRPPPTVSEALAGLGAAGTEGAPQGHGVPVHSDLARQRIQSLTPGQTTKDLPEDLLPASYGRRAKRRVSDGTPSAHRGGPPTGMRRLRGDRPSCTITGSAPLELVHPTEDRFLTLRECARLQGFLDDFNFYGSRTEQAVLIGNAVPPPFAKVLGEWMMHRGPHMFGHEGGRLMEFRVGPKPSPGSALWRTQRTVMGQFGEQRLAV